LGAGPAVAGGTLRRRKDAARDVSQTRPMTTRRLLAVLLVVMAVTVAVARSRQSGVDEIQYRDYPVTGVVTASPADGTVMVSHEDIAGYMPAMTMPFAIAPGEDAPRLMPGDRVRFVLRVDDTTAAAVRFEVVGHDGSVARALSGASASTAQPRLRKGDQLPDVSLVTEAGARFTTGDLRGQVTAVTFIFTRCPMPQFCPLMVKRFQQVQRSLAGDLSLADVRLLAVTLDPAFDTPAILAAYGEAMQADPARWRFLTGPPAEITRLTKAFAIHVERNGVLVDHTLATAVIGRDGRVVDIWRGNGWNPAEVLTTLRSAAGQAMPADRPAQETTRTLTQ